MLYILSFKGFLSGPGDRFVLEFRPPQQLFYDSTTGPSNKFSGAGKSSTNAPEVPRLSSVRRTAAASAAKII